MEAVIGVRTYNRLPAHQKERRLPNWFLPVAYNWKKILFISVIMTLLIGGIAFCDRAGQGQAWRQAEGTMYAWPINAMDVIFGVDDLDGSSALLRITKHTTSVKVGDYNLSIMSALNTVNGIFVNIGTCWLLVCWCASFFDMLMQNNNQMIAEQMIRKFIYLVVGLALVQNAMVIVFALVNFGTEVLSAIAQTASNDTTLLDEVKNTMYEKMTEGEGIIGTLSNIVTWLGYFVELFVPWIICMICSVLLSVVCWTRAVEIFILSAVSPVMFADIGDDRNGLMHTSAMRAFKNMLALALSGALIYASLYISCQISASVMADSIGSDYGSACWTQVVLAITRIGLCSKASTIAKQIVGLA